MSTAHEGKKLVSPCVKLCRIDQERALCMGCLRTIDEIVQWASMSDEQRADVMASLPARGTPVTAVPAG